MSFVIFLDIDGVLKPARSYFKDEYCNPGGGFDPLAVAAVNKLCRVTGAGIVFNTTWNYRHDPDILQIAQQEGLTGKLLGKTNYPRTASRLQAIEEWIKNHPTAEVSNWVALDDAPIIHKNAVKINPEFGVGLNDYNDALEILGFNESFIVLI